ncbi:MAG: polysaccharide biosynthesis C-terminal domain-containing protein [Acidimicrobiia bacterium]|nr:polysaccharide biosynthesis C-terminal domain-containing protein [Acidimicrobiia bacterium]
MSSYLYAYAFFQLPFGLLAVSLMTTLAPDLASAATRGDLGELRRGYSLGVRLIALVMVPAAAGYLALAGPIITALLQRGEFGATSTALTSDVLAMFALGLVPFSVYLFTLRAFYSLQDTRTPFLVNSFENGMNVVLAFALYPWLGVPGLALAFSLAYVLGAGVALVALRRRIASLDGRRLATVATRVVVAGAATALAAWAVARVLDWAGPREAVATLAVGILAGAVVYVASLAVLRVDEARLLLRRRPVAGP